MNQTRTIRLPIHIVKELNVYLRTARELSHRKDIQQRFLRVTAQRGVYRGNALVET